MNNVKTSIVQAATASALPPSGQKKPGASGKPACFYVDNDI